MKKKFITATGFLLIPAIMMAQKENPVNKEDIPTKENTFIQNSQLLTFSQLDQRKIYHWGNGQRSTPTGRQAGEVTPKYVRVMGDSAVVVWQPFIKPEVAKNK
ncbi:MAG: hypothetical protein IT214_14760 [Chitinophagaceae bacterium]|jgi:hypothetical protein|nr:hypothetical protein [Chitinophagaceae bacterium]OQY96833.1 MAG: hypothetical protein B6D37_00795 [Sphingobacteriales bacterium UTBCD1]